MERYAIKELLEWKNRKDRKPMLLLGARQVGKTWLMKEFGRSAFKSTAYVNFDKNQRMSDIFKRDFDIQRILMALQLETGVKIVPEETLVILDEIQSCPAAVTSLKYFCEDAGEYSVMAAGSLLGVANLEGTGFPVGKVDRMYLYPMTFQEFLNATDNTMLTQLIRSRDWKLMEAFHERVANQLRYYYFIGGMPEVVASFVADKDFSRVRHKQLALLADYRDSFGKHAPRELKARIEMIWDAIPAQLARENKKFTFSSIRNGGSSATLSSALAWLKSSGLVYLAHRVSKPSMPLKSYTDNAFKVYFLDVGLLAAASHLGARTILEGNRIFQEFKGALTEQYVMQQLLAEYGMPPYYWTSNSGQAEVDFLWEDECGIFPLEAKAEKNLQAKSLKSYCQKYRPELAIRTSMAHYFKQTLPFSATDECASEGRYTLLDLPLPCLGVLREEIRSCLASDARI